MESYFKTKSIFGLIAKWKWHILVISVVAGVLGAVFSMPYFIHPKYRSSAIVYPANIITYSDESESEQMQEILLSDDIKFKVIAKYDLYTHYGVDSTQQSSLAKLMGIYNDNVSIEKTPNDAIIVTVCDEDPQIAADIANDIINFYDELVLYLGTQKSREQLAIYTISLNNRKLLIDSLTNELDKYTNEYGLIDRKSQVRAYSEAVAQGRSLDEAHKILGNWQKYGTAYDITDSLLFATVSRYVEDQNRCEMLYRDINKQQSYSHVVSKPFVADKKFYPVRWLIVLLSLIGGALISIIALAIIEGCRKSPQVDTEG